MTDEEKLATFERAGITDDFIDETDRQIEPDEFFDGMWTTAERHEPVIVQVEMDPALVASIDRRAREKGMTRSQYLSALASA